MKPTDFQVLNTVTDYARYYGLPAPAHPLLTLMNLAQVRERTFPDPVVSHLYTVALERGLKDTMYYGQQTHDFQDGVLMFFAPGQVVQS